VGRPITFSPFLRKTTGKKYNQFPISRQDQKSLDRTYAATAALAHFNIARSKHSGIVAAFGGYLVKSGEVEPEFGRIEAVVLFGSKARGDFTAESDIDLLIVLGNDTLTQREQLRGLTFDILIETGVYLATQILSADLFRQLPTRRPLFYANLIRDGIVLYARPGVSLPMFTRRVELPALA